ncbi:hypothetical protein SNOG_06226 [Parastagonospora nodorum SN15]|uniref:Uncharacterized protein n=1 Tax=Phaeosphaeria nodorum (strain SN15 / ATCC MYA-4574 / FGSC 10173) TaxID=321614 RepID=Q0UPT8_PHANO|nr:hypothetical protein SNOG_06226 [Parastagonospora nodorum SN15]EAT86057.1 hypothetical protein SNOG_06226 [Parastagonospora nodorum SN15]
MPFASDEHTIVGYTAYKPNLAILQVSKQDKDEALQAGWQDTRWFQFFGVQQSPDPDIDTTQSRGYLLATMPDLVDLQIWFCSPDDGWNASPWGSRFITGPHVCS